MSIFSLYGMTFVSYSPFYKTATSFKRNSPRKKKSVIQVTLEQAAEIFRECNRKILPNKKLRCPIIWNTRFRTCMGRANIAGSLNSIELSVELFERASLEEQLATIYHEAAHILTFRKYGQVSAHGREWKHVMKQLGQKPERCHTVSVKELRNKTSKLDMTCSNCRTLYKVSKNILTRIRRGTSVKQCKCGKIINKQSLKDFIIDQGG